MWGVIRCGHRFLACHLVVVVVLRFVAFSPTCVAHYTTLVSVSAYITVMSWLVTINTAILMIGNIFMLILMWISLWSPSSGSGAGLWLSTARWGLSWTSCGLPIWLWVPSLYFCDIFFRISDFHFQVSNELVYT